MFGCCVSHRMGAGNLGGNGTIVYDSATLRRLFLHDLYGCLRAKKGAGQIDIDCFLPVCKCQVLGRDIRGTNACVVEKQVEAVKWYRKAAEQGDADAQYSLGSTYAKGLGVPEDSVAAYAWYSVAATSGDYNAPKKRDAIKRSLTPSQLEKGQVMAREIFERIAKQKAEEGE